MNKGNISADLLAEYNLEIESARQEAIQKRLDDQDDEDWMDYWYDDPISFDDDYDWLTIEDDYWDDEPDERLDDFYEAMDDLEGAGIMLATWGPTPPPTTREHYERIWRECNYLTEDK